MNTKVNKKKQCSKCGEVKPLEEFYRDKSLVGGRCNACKCCNDISRQKHHALNPQLIKSYRKKYYERHKGRILECTKARRIRQMKEHGTSYDEKRQNRLKKHVAELNDIYLKDLIQRESKTLLGSSMPYKSITPEMIELKREQLQFHRKLKEVQHGIAGTGN